MPSFRARVLDALDIRKDHVRIPTHEVFPGPPISDGQDATDNPASKVKVYAMNQYAISQTIRKSKLGPSDRYDKLDVLGFVVGDDPGSVGPNGPNPLPDALNRNISTTNRTSNEVYSGIHFLGGLYDATNEKLASMRKSSMVPKAHQSLMWYPEGDETAGVDHTHKDWPSDRVEQAQLLQDDPYADALYYHSTKVRFFLTGLDDVATAGSGDAAANHRGSVRMLVLRPKVPKVNLRVNGSNSDFVVTHDYMPNWDTELFYDRRHQIGGRLHNDIHAHNPAGSGVSNQNADAITSYGLEYVNDIREHNVDVDPTSPTYGYSRPTRMKTVTSGGTFTETDAKHVMTPFDLLTSRINTNKYAVLEDKVFTLDSLHHGAASHHVVNVTIPYNKKVRFQGRKPTLATTTTTETDNDGNDVTTTTVNDPPEDANADILSDDTFNEPLNLQSRPIVLFLSYNQRISAQCQGYTTISEC